MTLLININGSNRAMTEPEKADARAGLGVQSTSEADARYLRPGTLPEGTTIAAAVLDTVGTSLANTGTLTVTRSPVFVLQ